MAHKRRKSSITVVKGRRCAICQCQATPQWRRSMWQDRWRYCCNKCGIALKDFVARTHRDHGRKPTQEESAVWAAHRVNAVTETPSSDEASSSDVGPMSDEAAAWALVKMKMSLSPTSCFFASSEYLTCSSSFSSTNACTATPSSSYDDFLDHQVASSSSTALATDVPVTLSSEAVSIRPKKGKAATLFVEVDKPLNYDDRSDPGMTDFSGYSPTFSTFEVVTPASISSFPDEILFGFPPKKLVEGRAAYELR